MIEVEVNFPTYSVPFRLNTTLKAFAEVCAQLNDSATPWLLANPDADGACRVFNQQHISHIIAREVTSP